MSLISIVRWDEMEEEVQRSREDGKGDPDYALPWLSRWISVVSLTQLHRLPDFTHGLLRDAPRPFLADRSGLAHPLRMRHELGPSIPERTQLLARIAARFSLVDDAAQAPGAAVHADRLGVLAVEGAMIGEDHAPVGVPGSFARSFLGSVYAVITLARIASEHPRDRSCCPATCSCGARPAPVRAGNFVSRTSGTGKTSP